MKHWLWMFVCLFQLAAITPSFAKDTTLQGTLNINTATPTELMMLPGVGEAKAQAIVATRTQKPFANKEDILAVKGIGEKMLATWDGLIVFSGATNLKEVSGVAPAAKPAN